MAGPEDLREDRGGMWLQARRIALEVPIRIGDGDGDSYQPLPLPWLLNS